MWNQSDGREHQEKQKAKIHRRFVNHQQRFAEPNFDHLLVFGYQCKLFRDDERARSVNSGQQLIPWMGDENIMIDRYDARGHLSDLSTFEPKNFKNLKLNEQELKLQQELDLERFADLKYEDSEEEHEKAKEEHQSDSYANVPFNYGDVDKVPEDVDNNDNYRIPEGLNVPSGIVLPDSMKLHAVIEKTAEFLAKQNSQMEILLKASNPSFSFLSADSEHYAYYKHLLNEIKCGNWSSKGKKKNSPSKANIQDKKEAVSREKKNQLSGVENSCEDSDEDEHYLHPSLLSSAKVSNKNIPKITSTNSKYLRIANEFKSKYSIHDEDDSTSKESDEKEDSREAKIPEDVIKIIEKLAESVAKNGDKFENSIRALNDVKFAFLLTTHEHHPYYIERKIHFFKQFKQEELRRNPPKSSTVMKAFSLNSRDEPKLVDHSMSALLNQHTSDSSQTKEKTIQDVRKQRAMEFLKSVKNVSSQASVNTSMTKPIVNISRINTPAEPQATFGPQLPTPPTVYSTDDEVDELIENFELKKPEIPRKKKYPAESSLPSAYELDIVEDDEVEQTSEQHFKPSKRFGRHIRSRSRSNSSGPINSPRDRERSKSRSRDRSRKRERSHSRKSKSRSRDRSRKRSRSRSRKRSKERTRNEHKSRHHKSSRSSKKSKHSHRRHRSRSNSISSSPRRTKSKSPSSSRHERHRHRSRHSSQRKH